ncbi:TPA: site-specific integrase [Klebsiella aerogenes]|nr:site-specific integrase [Salmonella enterica]HDT4317136.1 site-specific integrase [Klebsiella aerogenes]
MFQTLKKLQENQYSVFETKDCNFKVIFAHSKWKISESITLNIDSLRVIVSAFMPIKTTLAYFAINYSASYTKKMFYAIKHYIRVINKDDSLLSKDCIQYYYKNVSSSDYTHAETLKYFFMKMIDIYPSLFSAESIIFITNVKVKKSYTSKHIKTHDYKRGPFSDSQLKVIIDSVEKAHREEKVSLSNYLLLILIAYSGRRPMQISQLEVGDLFNSNGEYYLNVPRIKQRNGYRKEFRRVQIPEELFRQLTFLVEAVISLVSETLNLELSEKQKRKLPIFINTYLFKKKCVELSMIDNGGLKLTPYAITLKIRNTINCAINKPQDYLGVINSRRFRYSLGTKSAQLGYSPSLIANVLDHSSINSVMSYIENTAENGKKINESVNDLMKPLANKFIEGKELERELNSLKNLIDKYYESCKRTFLDNNELLTVKNEIDDLINSI